MEQKENQSTSGSSISNFFTNTPSTNNNNISHPITSQAFPPIENNPQQYQQSLSYNQNNPQQNTLQTQPIPTTQKSFFEKVNSTATGVFDYIKNKAPVLPSNIIPKKLLDNVDPLTIISEIKLENKGLLQDLKNRNANPNHVHTGFATHHGYLYTVKPF